MKDRLKRITMILAILGVILFVVGVARRGISGGDAAAGAMIAVLFGTVRGIRALIP